MDSLQHSGVQRAGCKEAHGDKVCSACGSINVHLYGINLHGCRPHLEDKLAKAFQRQRGGDTWSFQIGASSRSDRMDD